MTTHSHVIERFDPYLPENRYSLDLACYFLHREQPHSIRICTDNPNIVLALIRRLGWVQGEIVVETPHLAESVHAWLGRSAVVTFTPTMHPEAVILPFSRKQYEHPPLAPFLVGIAHNALSYKSLLYPGQIQDNVLAFKRWIKQGYRLDERVGMFSPRFLFEWAISVSAGTRFHSLHFRMGQKALDHIYSRSPLWWMGYLTILTGRRD